MKDAEIDKWVQHVLQCTREMFEERGLIPAHSLVLATRHPETGESLARPGMIFVGSESLENVRDKDALAEATRLACEKSRAIAVAFVAESWIHAPPAGMSNAEARAEAYRYGEIANHPDRREVIFVSVERRCSGKVEAWSAEITRPDGKAVLGPWEQKMGTDGSAPEVSGRFTGFVQPAN